MKQFFICYPNGKVDIGPHEGVKNLWPIGTFYVEVDSLRESQHNDICWVTWRRKISAIQHSYADAFAGECLHSAHIAFFTLLGITKLGF